MKKLTDREQAKREHESLKKRLLRAKQEDTQQRIIPKLVDAFQRTLPNRKENLKAATNLSPQGKQFHLSIAKHSALSALRRNNLDIFFRDLKLMPALLKDDDIWEQSVAIWLKQKFWIGNQGKAALKNLKRIGSTLAEIEGAPEYETPAERDAAKKTSWKKATAKHRGKGTS